MTEKRLQWHPAFQAALQIELSEDREFLRFFDEYNLSKKPMQVDTLIVNATPGRKIHKSIGWIFREHNIIEYKNPGDFISINDFYRVFGYTCSYQSNTRRIQEIMPDSLTITLIGNRYPRKLAKHLKNLYGVKVYKALPGIYYVKGLMFPMQIIKVDELQAEEYIWLSRLRDNLTAGRDIERLSKAYRGKDKDPLYATVMEFLVQANRKEYEEGKEMCEALRELFAEELNEREETGKAEGKAEVVSLIRKKYLKNDSPAQAAEALELEEDYTSRIMNLIHENPELDDFHIALHLLAK